MSEYNKPTNEAEFKQNFKQKKALMNKTEAHYESSRCLFCYDAPCIVACPTSIDIPLFIKQIQTGNVEGAAKTIYDANWMGNSCGIVCPTGVLCEGACVYNHQDVAPLQIGRLQNYATKTTIEKGKHLYSPGVANGKKVAVIGGGPAGLSCACELRVLGYEVDVFEAKSTPAGLNLHGVAPYKISNEEVMAEVNYLQAQLGFNIKCNSPINSKEDLSALESNYDAIFIGIGLGVTAYRNIPGEDKNGVIGAVEFIEGLRSNKDRTSVGERVVVLGGGNTAMDAASESARMGAKDVTLAYRSSKDKMGAYSFEYELAVSAGVKGCFGALPLEILGNGSVTGVRFIRENGEEFDIACDMVIKATGQAKCGTFFNEIDGLELDQHSRIKVNEETFQTTNPLYFAGGDAVNGGAEVVNAAQHGKAAAKGIDVWLKNK